MKTPEGSPEFDLDYLCRLARLSLSGSEVAEFGGQLDSILNYVRRLESVNVDGVEAMAHGTAIYNVMDEDAVDDPLDRGGFLSNAPESEDGQVRVPRVIET